jgi:hypothetical protein
MDGFGERAIARGNCNLSRPRMALNAAKSSSIIRGVRLARA